MEKFKHVRPTNEYEKDAVAYINEFYEYNSRINGVGGLYKFLDNYDGWLDRLESDRNAVVSSDKVPTETFFLVRSNDNYIVGMINIRFALNERLKMHGGNIGYSIRPLERNKGYNKVNLYLGLLCCQEHGIKEVLLDCDKDNLGSARTIKSLGGILKNEFYDDKYGVIIQQYVIDVDSSVRDNRNKYDKLLDN